MTHSSHPKAAQMQSSFERAPKEIQLLLRDYVTLLDQKCSGLIAGVYLHGSIALGAFDPSQSDIDFITVLKRRCNEVEFEHLRNIHQQIAGKYPHWKMDGSYLQTEDLGQSCEAIEPYPYCASHDGVLHLRGQYEVNPVTWWLLKTRGIAIVGSDPQTLNFSISWEVVSAYTRNNLKTYWANWTRRPWLYVALLTDYNVQWVVLGVLRLYCALQKNDIVTKSAASECGLNTLPKEWHQVIREAISIRDTGRGHFYRLRAMRAWDTVRFVRYIIRKCSDTI